MIPYRHLMIVCLAAWFSTTAKGATTAAKVVIAAAPAPNWQIDRMTCEYRVNPLGMDEALPRFAWTFLSSHRDEYQSAYRILVASSRETLEQDSGDIWNSGAVPSSDNINALFAGRSLAPF